MPDIPSSAGVNSNITNSPAQPQSSAGFSSPWDEPLPEEEEKPKVVGSLGLQQPAELPAVKPVDTHPSFNVPMDIDKDSPLNTVQPEIPSPAVPAVSASARPVAPAASAVSVPVPADFSPEPVPIPTTPTAPEIQPLLAETPADLNLMPEKPKMDITRLSSLLPNNSTEQQTLSGEKDIPNMDQAAGMVHKKGIDMAKLLPWLIGLAVLVILSLFIYLTEIGYLSIGLEKVYGAVGIETLWGGLSANPEKALGQSMTAMSVQTDYKISGNITLTIDKTINSTVTTPLVSINTPEMIIAQTNEKAILASSFMDTGDSSTTDLSTSSADTSSASTDSTSTTATSTSSSTAATSTDQAAGSPYQSAGLASTIKTLSANFQGFVGSSGNQVDFDIAKAVGTDQLSLKNSGRDLWVQSDQIQYNANATSGQWVLYSIAGLSGKSLPADLFTADVAKTVTVKGSRSGNEVVGDTRCYNYQIDNLDLGNALAGMGIASGTTTLISGNVWIGIQDKLIRKIDLRITPSSDSAVTAIRVTAQISDYGIANSFQAPLAGSTISATGSATTSATAITADLSTPAGRDTKRKNDLVLIKAALSRYHSAKGTYPIVANSIQLLTSGNALETALVPTYTSALPIDPKESEGWAYNYKSPDGVSFSLSARLENTSDPEAKLVAGAYLYFLYND